MINGTMANTPVRQVKAKVELYNGSTLARTFNSYDALKSIKLERVGEAKFFGFGYAQKLNFHLRDTKSEIEVTTANTAKVFFNDVNNFPVFKITESHRDENTGELSITAYDAIYNDFVVSDLTLSDSYTIREFANACALLIGASALVIESVADNETCFNTYFPTGANFDGTETIREALNAIAEATQTIYFINNNNALVFKRLSVNGEAVLNIDKDLYIDLDSGTNRRLASIVSVTELGDNVSASATYSGTTQYVRNNPFWDLREDIGVLVDNALAAVGGLTINQFNCFWRGNYLLELGDKISLTTKDNQLVNTYLLNDVISYNGSYSQESKWEYTDSEETATNPSTLGEQLKQTYARVDKANKQIELVASETSANTDNISALQINTNSISSSVKSMEVSTNQSLESIEQSLLEIDSKIEQTAADIRFEFTNTDINSVTTATGFTFNEVGLTIEKSGAEMKTTITEDGMTVYKDNSAVLTANNIGVEAVNLHATTYLIIGTNSRFEDYGSGRTGCFWIGE